MASDDSASSGVLKWVRLFWEVIGGWWSLMSGAIAIPIGAYALYQNWSATKVLAVVAISALLTLCIVMGRKNWALLAQKEQKLIIACGENITPPTVGRTKHLYSRAGHAVATADLFGFSLTNAGPGIIIKCRAVLTSVENDGKVVCTDSGTLPFEPLNPGPDLEVVDLHPGFTQRASVCSMKDDGTVHAGSFGMLWRHARFPEYFATEGDYTLNVTVAAENLDEPKYLKFIFHKGKDRGASSIELRA